MSKKIRIAVIGAGHLGRFHAKLAATNDDFDLVAVVDPAVEARQKLAAEVGVKPAADYRSLLGQIDAAVVARPPCATTRSASNCC